MKYEIKLNGLYNELMKEMRKMTPNEIYDFIKGWKEKLCYKENKMTYANYQAFKEISDCALKVLKEKGK